MLKTVSPTSTSNSPPLLRPLNFASVSSAQNYESFVNVKLSMKNLGSVEGFSMLPPPPTYFVCDIRLALRC